MRSLPGLTDSCAPESRIAGRPHPQAPAPPTCRGLWRPDRASGSSRRQNCGWGGRVPATTEELWQSLGAGGGATVTGHVEWLRRHGCGRGGQLRAAS